MTKKRRPAPELEIQQHAIARIPTQKLLADLRRLIQHTRTGVAHAVNAALVLLYWQVGTWIRTDVLRKKRAEYGEQILPTLSAKLVPEYGQGFSERNLARMIRFAEIFPDRDVVDMLSPLLGWSHFVELIYLKTDLHRKDSYIDLLFYHRKLRRLIAIDLKLTAFQAADKGQMELYLRWLEKHEMEPEEEAPIGLILCEDKGEEQIELLELDKSGIRVASYLTDLPPKAVLRKKLRAATALARKRLMDG